MSDNLSLNSKLDLDKQMLLADHLINFKITRKFQIEWYKKLAVDLGMTEFGNEKTINSMNILFDMVRKRVVVYTAMGERLSIKEINLNKEFLN